MKPGRPKCPRRIEAEPVATYFKPRGVPLKDLEIVLLSLEELEAVRLSDLEGLDQEMAARRMGISRRALWEDLQNARGKMVDALVNGKAIEIRGGNYTIEGRPSYTCRGCHAEWNIPSGSEDPSACPECGSTDLERRTNAPARRHGPGCRGGCCHKNGGPAASEERTRE
jgi:predicted DNA-binding protein (UPF0251 family)/DNA-directed RNA polymerase subunit RPC12/RpoP